ncbi:G-protein coupled receptor dmsr-1-like [Macrosteles quadrilineatus]|uniref:G-protein coupled receptor dmsr-1-like n=1 Tax=Macrosteles quadrilineatus TaxID=74068 RepID=UPI0023E0F34D|nr:G-protein coupled receptor dmsr-1-like [Macrosteles quadrilineatus]
MMGQLDYASTDMADYYIRMLTHLRNHSDMLKTHENLLNLLNVTEEDLQMMFNTTQAIEAAAPCYCGGTLRKVVSSYRQIHGYFSLVVCVFGTIANILNILVLTRKELINSPINRILTGIAVADMLVMLEYIPFSTYMYVLLPPGVKHFSHSEAVYILVHMHFSQLMHTISISLTLTLALWRYLAIQFPHKTHTMCSDQRCTTAITMAFALPVLICIPSYLVFSVRETRVMEHQRVVTLYHLDLSDLAKQDNELLYTANFWLYAVVVKLLPCAVLTLVSYWLVSVLWQVNARKQRLRCDVFPAVAAPRVYKPEKRVDRTTKMLVAVLLLFLITEIPQGVLGLLSGILGRCFFKNCYHQLGELMDILALINGAINFILYCSMSRQFRDTFSKMFKPRILAKCAPHNTEVHSTYV